MSGFLGLDPGFSEYDNAKVVVVPVPYERTTSYIKGTRLGPQAIIDASNYVELYDEELDTEIYTVGIHTLQPLLFNERIDDDFKGIEHQVRRLLKEKKFPVILGGEHSITYPVFKAYASMFPDISMLQFDAHADLRDQYEESKYSHACVMRRVQELSNRIVQAGIRSLSVEEAEYIKASDLNVNFANQMRKEWDYESMIDQLSQDVYITIDVDFFDPSVMPSTGTPEPGGFFWDETLIFLKKIFESRNVIGFDIVELSPVTNLVHPDFMIAKLVYKMLGYKFVQPQKA